MTLFAYGFVGLGAALLLALGACGIQTYRLHSTEAAYDALVAAGRAQQAVNEKKAKADAKLKEAKDDEYKRRIAAADARYRKLLDGRPSVLPTPEPADRVNGATLACFDREQLDAALARFIERVAGLALEGDQASIGLTTAREWVQELLRRQ